MKAFTVRAYKTEKAELCYAENKADAIELAKDKNENFNNVHLECWREPDADKHATQTESIEGNWDILYEYGFEEGY